MNSEKRKAKADKLTSLLLLLEGSGRSSTERFTAVLEEDMKVAKAKARD